MQRSHGSRQLLLYVFSVADVLSTEPTKLVPALLGTLVVMDAKFLVLAACRSSFLVLLLFFLVPSCVYWILSVVPDVLYLTFIYNENGSGRRKPAVAPSKKRIKHERFSTLCLAGATTSPF